MHVKYGQTCKIFPLTLKSFIKICKNILQKRMVTSPPLILEKCYIYSIFTTNPRWSIVIGSKLNSLLTLLFYPPITASNNLQPKIYYEKYCKHNISHQSYLLNFFN